MKAPIRELEKHRKATHIRWRINHPIACLAGSDDSNVMKPTA